MKVNRLYLASVSGKLTCSEVMQILMDQPTKPDGRKIEWHAHMYTMEGFTPRATGFAGDAFSLERKQFHYENPTHLHPEGTDFGGPGCGFWPLGWQPRWFVQGGLSRPGSFASNQRVR